MSLAGVFASSLPGRPDGRTPEADAASETRLEAAVARARAAWPTLALDPAAFVGFAARRLEPGEGEALDAFEALRLEDLYLAFGCSGGDPRALAAFEARYFAALPRYLARLKLDEHAVDEIAQQLRQKLFVAAPEPKIASYLGRGPLEGWFRATAVRAAISRQRGVRPAPRGSDDEAALVAAGIDPELAYLKERYRQPFEEAFTGALRALSTAQRTLLRMHYLDGLTLDQLAAVGAVHRATTARHLAQARAALFEGTRSVLRKRLVLTDSEFVSLIGVVRSEITPQLEKYFLSEHGSK